MATWANNQSGSLITARTSNRIYHAAYAMTFLLILSLIHYVNFSTLRAD
jgi:hypothetical protein